MNDIHLHGALGARFGKHFYFDVETVQEVLQALAANFPAFRATIRKGYYRIVVGKTAKSGIALGEAELIGFNLGNRAVHIIPATAGRKRGGLGKVIAGVALVGLSMVSGAGGFMAAGIGGSSMTGAQMIGSMGMSMALTGVASMLAPEQDSPDQTKSYTITGPNGNINEGAIIPIVYGEVVTGGYMISGAVEINGPANDRSVNSVPLDQFFNGSGSGSA